MTKSTHMNEQLDKECITLWNLKPGRINSVSCQKQQVEPLLHTMDNSGQFLLHTCYCLSLLLPPSSLPCPMPILPPPLSPLSRSLRWKTFFTLKAKYHSSVRRLQSGLTPPSSAPSISTGSAATNQGRLSLQARYERGKLHSSVLRYSTMMMFNTCGSPG